MIHIVTLTFNINKISQRARHTFIGHTENTLHKHNSILIITSFLASKIF